MQKSNIFLTGCDATHQWANIFMLPVRLGVLPDDTPSHFAGLSRTEVTTISLNRSEGEFAMLPNAGNVLTFKEALLSDFQQVPLGIVHLHKHPTDHG